MRRIVILGHHDLRLFLRNRASWVWLFLIPLGFTWFTGLANRGPGAPSSPRPPVLIENHDTGFVSRVFLDTLGAQGMDIVHPTNRADAARGLRLPADFTVRVLEGRPANAVFFTVAGSDEQAAAMIEVRVVRALIALNSHLIEHAAAHGTGAPVTEDALRTIAARPDPVGLDVTFAGRRPIPAGFHQSLPGNLVMFLMMNLLIFGGTTLAEERRNGVLGRLLTLPLRRGELIAGKLYGLVLLGAAQVIFLLLAARLLFDVDFGARPGAVALTLLVYAWVAASAGLLVGSLSRNEDKITGLCVLASLVMAALGGCWWPLELAPDALKTAARLVPTGWAMIALHQLISFGGTLRDAAPALGVLALFGLAANAAAVRFFKA